jgi:hypothetical protein
VVAFVASVIFLAIGIGVVVLVGRRRAPGTPLTWGEAMVASTWVFFLMFIAYGVVPHQWLQWAGNELNWRSDTFAAGPDGWLPAITFFGRGRILVTKQAVKDIIATVVYVVAIGGQVYLWAWWQKRGQRKEQPAVETSAYGRPLVRRA